MSFIPPPQPGGQFRDQGLKHEPLPQEQLLKNQALLDQGDDGVSEHTPKPGLLQRMKRLLKRGG